MKSIAICAAVVAAAACTGAAWAQPSESVIFSFNLTDGNLPNAGLVADAKGNLYGTTSYNGGRYGYGNVFELSQAKDGGWTETVLYDFTGGADGAWPLDTPIFDAAGNLYGVAEAGGKGQCIQDGEKTLGCGVVFELVHGKRGWREKVLFSFEPGEVKGVIPVGGVIFDALGNLYGTTWAPGVKGGPLHANASRAADPFTFWGCSDPGCGGTVYELTPTADGWKEKDLYAFTGEADGSVSQASLIFDSAGNLYGTTAYGGMQNCPYGCGVAFELSPGRDKWSEKVIHAFSGGDGASPLASLIFDKAGNLYGTASERGNGGAGTVFELRPKGKRWRERTLYTFSGGTDGGNPYAAVIMDGKGDLYGTANQGGSIIHSAGVVYKLVHSSGAWKENILHTFDVDSDDGDGALPVAPLLRDAKGDFYGTTQAGGANGHGAVFVLDR